MYKNTKKKEEDEDENKRMKDRIKKEWVENEKNRIEKRKVNL